MENYTLKEIPKLSPQEEEFQKEAKQIFDEITEVLAKHEGWELNPTIQVTPKGIFPSISLDKKPPKNIDLIAPEPIIIPR